MSQATIDVLTSAAFFTGILAGATALLLGWLGYIILDAGDRPVRAGGIILAVAGLVAISMAGIMPTAAVLGVVLLGIAGSLPLPAALAAVLAIPGAVILASSAGLEQPAAAWLLVVAIVVAAPLVATFDRAYAANALPIPMYALAVVGLFFSVPDTEIAVILLGTMATGLFLGWPKPAFALGSGGSYALVGLFLWVAAVGGAARPVSIVVAGGCLGLLVAEPVGRWVSHRRGSLLSDGRVEETAILLIQLVVVAILARAILRVDTAWLAAALTFGLLGAAALGVALRMGEPARLPERADS